MVTALKIRPGKHPAPTLLCDDRDFLNCAVSVGMEVGGTAGAMRLDDAAIIYNKEGPLLGADGNRRVGPHILAGTFYVVGHADGRLISLSDDQMERYTSRFWQPEYFSEDEVLDSWFDRLCAAMDME